MNFYIDFNNVHLEDFEIVSATIQRILLRNGIKWINGSKYIKLKPHYCIHVKDDVMTYTSSYAYDTYNVVDDFKKIKEMISN